jgi:hypothetical protein
MYRGNAADCILEVSAKRHRDIRNLIFIGLSAQFLEPLALLFRLFSASMKTAGVVGGVGTSLRIFSSFKETYLVVNARPTDIFSKRSSCTWQTCRE